ncbi:hypothetical protein HZH66_010208 [Vespula vulgaris]|uniref:Uncharacterized protein n=1 Tax=Vespula vulgaris TaxID=7454 RepID=A0A834JPC1_VESVU|nr:hypothetical protein HZH66_010208 [Vespula vulgaris]
MWCLVSQANSVILEVQVDPKAIGQECLEKKILSVFSPIFITDITIFYVLKSDVDFLNEVAKNLRSFKGKRSSEVEVFLGNDELAFTQHIVALDIPLYESWHEVLRAFEDTTTRMSGRAPLAIWRICSVEVEERLDSRYADGEIYILKCECL